MLTSEPSAACSASRVDRSLANPAGRLETREARTNPDLRSTCKSKRPDVRKRSEILLQPNAREFDISGFQCRLTRESRAPLPTFARNVEHESPRKNAARAAAIFAPGLSRTLGAPPRLHSARAYAPRFLSDNSTVPARCSELRRSSRTSRLRDDALRAKMPNVPRAIPTFPRREPRLVD